MKVRELKHRAEECYNNTKKSPRLILREIRELIVSFLGKNKKRGKSNMGGTCLDAILLSRGEGHIVHKVQGNDRTVGGF